MDKEKSVLLDNRAGRLSQQLRTAQSVCDWAPLKPPLPLLRLSHYPAQPPSHYWERAECGSVGVGGEMAFVPFIESAAGLSSLGQQAAAQWHLAEDCCLPIATWEEKKSFTNSGEEAAMSFE